MSMTYVGPWSCSPARSPFEHHGLTGSSLNSFAPGRRRLWLGDARVGAEIEISSVASAKIAGDQPPPGTRLMTIAAKCAVMASRDRCSALRSALTR